MSNYFSKTIEHLRHYEEVFLFGNLLSISESEKESVIDLLEIEYKIESVEYPQPVLIFDKDAAFWAAKIVYMAAQFMLYRETEVKDLPLLFSSFNGNNSEYQSKLTASQMLSADLCLRFLPAILINAQVIDPEDELIAILEKELIKFHYSAIGYGFRFEKKEEIQKTILDSDLELLFSDKSFLQLYTDRVFEKKELNFALFPPIKRQLKSNFGIYGNEFWKEFELEKNNTE
ncbi:hypothetical protein Fleli_3266 [Bernardetia litoralis DSM 6794]|uniref:MoxR-vWA-beta-propeller ternary system domain-containing protein n=1 Tax=Bernardetia litoralis (strain ATCC 23117 / DSM 6794 / NBRC 15988 / NCIMB 1366 / Fx l1 / Sio-4) TaxID=880071 RepID=I4ANR1_BERLS|nr:hypothetical protein [Bernardetia litoralis]AFM05596.1 hypothetical protein Fleli_3266 [Bernardetia litoralis DSM 6794]